MDPLYEKFVRSKQEPLRLSIALDGFVRADREAAEAYRNYLRRRLQPAAAALIAADDTERLACLAEIEPFTEKMTDSLLVQAQKEKKSAALVWLLRWKGERYGFRDRDFSL